MNSPTEDLAGADTLAALAQLTQAIQIESDQAFTFQGRLVSLHNGLAPSLYPTAQPLVTLLRDQLYEHAFIRTFKSPNAPAAPPPVANFAHLLSQANQGRERWYEGWRIEKVLQGGQVRAEKHGLRRTLWPGEYVLRDGSAMAPRVQAQLSVFQARESHALQSGFYFAYGEAVADEQDESHLLRFYWNVTAAGAPLLLANLTRILNRFGLPFKFKCLNAAEQFVRLDAAVLYVNRRFDWIVRALLDDVIGDLGHAHLGRATPLFTLPVRPGVALAEDPMGGESFGMNRCRIVAEGLWEAHLEHLNAPDQRLARVVAQFERYGLSLRHPHRNASSTFVDGH